MTRTRDLQLVQRTTGPVSYTHLDVYKRQGYRKEIVRLYYPISTLRHFFECAGDDNKTLRQTSVTGGAIIAAVIVSIIAAVIAFIDVYKRQHMECLTNHSLCLDVAPEPCMDSLSQEGFYQVEALTLAVPASLHS